MIIIKSIYINSCNM